MRSKNMSVTAYSNFPKIDSGTVISSNQSSNRPITAREDTENNGTIKTTSGRGKFLSTKSKNEINDKEVVSILEDFRIAYPIKEKFKTVVGNIEEGEPNQCIDIIKRIKKAKGKSLVFNKEIKKTKKEVIQ